MLLRVLLLTFTDMPNSKASIALLVLLWLVLLRYRPIMWVLESMWIGELYACCTQIMTQSACMPAD